jgi:23S rRNA-/tRNA-specific pseudouridylate synthase
MGSDEVGKEYFARVKGDFRKCLADESKEITVDKWVYVKDYKTMLHDCEDADKLTDEMRKTAKDA